MEDLGRSYVSTAACCERFSLLGVVAIGLKILYKMGSKIDVNFEWRLFKTPCFSIGKIMFVEIKWVQVYEKIDQKSIKKRSQDRKASWHRFLKDFGGFWTSRWARTSDKMRSDPGQIQSDQVRSGQIWSGLVRSGQIRSDLVPGGAGPSWSWGGEGFTRQERMGPLRKLPRVKGFM